MLYGSRGILNLARVRERRNGAAGQIIVLFALVIVLLMGLAAIVIDAGLLRTDAARLQNALDSGALAAAQSLPADNTNVANVTSTAIQFTQDNFPGVAAPDVEYACLIGITDAGLPRVSDMPTICNVSLAANSSSWRCTATVCWAPCDPAVTSTDICNTVTLRDSAVRQYTFGRAVGVNSGTTGTLVSAACTGACGMPPAAPVDVVMILDRTGSMQSSGSIPNLRNGGRAVLQAFDPALQRIALGFTGPSTNNDTCGSPGVNAVALDPSGASTPTYRSDTNAATATGGATSITVNRPTTSSAQDQVLIAGVSTAANVTVTPQAGNGWIDLDTTVNGAFKLSTFYKIVSGTEPSTYRFNFSASVRAVAFITRYSGVNPSDPIGNMSERTGSSTTPIGNGIATTSNNERVVRVFGGASPVTFGTGTGWTEQVDTRINTTTGPAIMSGDRLYGSPTSAASMGNPQVTTSATTVWATQMIALKPDPGETYGTDVNNAAHVSQWVSIGFSGTDSDNPPVEHNVAYVDTGTGVINSSSHVATAINCFDTSGTGTNLARPLYMALQYLQDHGRPGVKQGIILETDGAPNSSGYGPSSDYTNAGVLAAAATVKAFNNGAGNVELYTIGYGVDNSTVALLGQMASSSAGTTTCTNAENSDGDHFFCQPVGSDLSDVLRAAAVDLAGGSRLVQLYPRPEVSAVAPATGSKNGGTTVTITGKYFTEAYSVMFGTTPATSFTVVSDTEVRAVSPGGTANTIVDITVSTPGGTSKVVNADRFTYGP